MKGEKYYKKLSRITPIATPVLILLHAIFLCFTYNKQEDLGDWGGLVLAANIIFSIIGPSLLFIILEVKFFLIFLFTSKKKDLVIVNRNYLNTMEKKRC